MRSIGRLGTFLLAAAAAAQTPSPTPTFSAAEFRSHVAFLADDLLEGRDTGSRGYAIGAAYVAAQFEGLGLTPGGREVDGKRGWYVPIAFRSAKLGSTPARVTISGPAGTRSWANGTDVIVGPGAKAEVQDVSAPVVFVGYGIDAPGQGIDDYRGLDVRGKIVALFSDTSPGLPSEIAAHYGDERAAAASRHGAIGMIALPSEASLKAYSWARRVATIGGARMTWLKPDGKPIDEAPNVQASASLDPASADVLFAGAPRPFKAVVAEVARKGVRPKGFALKTSVRIERTSIWTGAESPEVVGLLPGSDPRLKDEYIVLMGHLDHLGLKPNARPGEDAIFNGALDNAAGVATMLEVARAFASTGERPKRSILFIANAGEEKGLLGADFFAHYPTVPIGKIAGVVDLDMPLLLYDFTDVIAFGADHNTVGAAVARAAGAMGVKLSPDPMPQEGIFTRSDHYEFVRQGVPAIMLATGYANGGDKQWGAFLRGNYHGVKDDLAQPIRWEQGARFARLNYLIARDLADNPERPHWYQGDFFGDLFAKDQPKVVRAIR